MNPTLPDHNVDLESGGSNVRVLRSSEIGESEANDTSVRPGLSEMTSNATLPVTQAMNTFPQPVVKHDAGPEGSDSGNAPTQAGQGDAQAPQKQEVDHVSQAPVPPPVASGHSIDFGPRHEKKPPMGDFGGSANALWELYLKEAKGNDESQIQSLNEDMDGVLIFAGLFSAVLTAFIIDSKENLKVNPQDQMVFYLQQNVALLDQISKQILSIAPQVPIPSTPPLPFPAFKPLETDIRVNFLWFMALTLSLVAAFLAILIQQRGRDYMHVFQRYKHPLKCARVRQYLHDGLMRWGLPTIAESVPGLFQASFFLFSVGLCDSILNVNTTVGLSTTIPIAVSVIYYVVVSYLPLIFPHSPYQTTFSGMLWYIRQRLPRLQHKYCGVNGESRSVSPDMTLGKMQFAMEETDNRKVRDEEGIRWLIRNMAEEDEMESLVMAIPDSFNCKWGVDLWENVYGSHTGPMALLPRSDSRIVRGYSTISQTERGHVMQELNARVAHLMETCMNRDRFASEELWRKRTRGCVETVVSLVLFTGTDLSRFGDIVKLLGDIGVSLKVRESESSYEGKDLMFVMRWTCLSLVAIQPKLASDQNLRNHARLAMSSLTEEHAGERQTPTSIIGTFSNALECLEELSGALILVENIKEEDAKEILRRHESPISTLVVIGGLYADSADTCMQHVQRDLVKTTHRIICQLPGIKFDAPDAESADLSQLKESYPDRPKLQFITLSHRLKRIYQVAQTFQDLLNGQWDTVTFKKGITDLQGVLSLLKDAPLHREVWRLQDLCEGRGLGITVELFLLALKQLLSTSSSKESHSALLMGTFQAITSDLSKYESPRGTQQLLLDCVVSNNDIVFDSTDAIIDEFFSLLATVLKGQSGPHIEDIVQLLTKKLASRLIFKRRAFYQKALEVINEANPSRPPS